MAIEDQIEEAKGKLEEGAIVIFPTETAYGIATDALDEESVDKVYRAKHRPREKGLTVIVDSLETAKQYAELSESEKKIVEEFMPGPLTLIAEKKEVVPDNLNEKFVFRISSGDIASKLAEFGPITATSANISGENTSYAVKDISDELLEKADYVIDAGELEKRPTSTIIELKDDEVIVHREGSIKKEEIEKVLQR